MAFITTGSQGFLLNIQPLQNVNTSATGSDTLNTLNGNVTDILKYINPTSGQFTLNTISLKNANQNFIKITNNVLFSSNIYMDNNAKILSSNALNGTDRLSFSVTGYEKARFTNTGFGIGTTNPITTLDVNGNTLLRGNLYISTMGDNPIAHGNLYVEQAIYASSILVGPRLAITHNAKGGLAINDNVIVTVDMIDGTFLTSSIGIGGISSPQSSLDISGSQVVRGNMCVSSMNSPAFGNLVVDNSLGIGTAVPETAVDVHGGAVFRGALCIGSMGGSGQPGDMFARGAIYASGMAIQTSKPLVEVDISGSGFIHNNLFLGNVPTKLPYKNGSLYASGGALVSSLGISVISTLSALDVKGTGLIRGDLHVSSFNGMYANRGNIYADGQLCVSSIGLGTRTPETYIDISGGDILTRGNMYISSMGIKQSQIGNVYADGKIYSAGVVIPSDPALKSNIRPYAYNGRLPDPIAFEWKHSGDYDIGVSAKDVQEIEPACVQSNQDGVLHVDYPKLTVLCLAELKELRTRITRLEAGSNSVLHR